MSLNLVRYLKHVHCSVLLTVVLYVEMIPEYVYFEMVPDVMFRRLKVDDKVYGGRVYSYVARTGEFYGAGLVNEFVGDVMPE